MSLDTARLRMIPCVPAHLLTLMESPLEFEAVAGFPAADGLRAMFMSDDVSPAWLATLRASKDADPWQHGFFLLDRSNSVAIGSAGFRGPVDDAGMVEIAYGVVPAVENRGLATEAAQALVTFAMATNAVHLVRAHTLPTPNASTRVLTKCGFVRVEELVDPDDGLVWRWERGR